LLVEDEQVAPSAFLSMQLPAEQYLLLPHSNLPALEQVAPTATHLSVA